jgi:dihydrofolate reductase
VSAPASARTTVSLIAAIAANRVIGRDGAMPWRIPEDLTRFRRLTMGHAVIMGRLTFASMGRPLAGRQNIVLTRDTGLGIPGCDVVHSLDQALQAVRTAPHGEIAEVFVIGGAAVYAQFLPAADRMYLTWVDAEVPGDTLFPDVAWDEWRVVRESPGAPSAGSLPHRFTDYARREK